MLDPLLLCGPLREFLPPDMHFREFLPAQKVLAFSWRRHSDGSTTRLSPGIVSVWGFQKTDDKRE